MKDIYRPKIGDVILDNNISVVIIAIKNHENYSSCSYDREYLVCEEMFINSNQGLFRPKDIERHGRWIQVKGSKFPQIEKLNKIPYNINEVNYYEIKQKSAKTIAVYE